LVLILFVFFVLLLIIIVVRISRRRRIADKRPVDQLGENVLGDVRSHVSSHLDVGTFAQTLNYISAHERNPARSGTTRPDVPPSVESISCGAEAIDRKCPTLAAWKRRDEQRWEIDPARLTPLTKR
jgi:hypothetical protein